jgi:hypothetical protein
MTGIPSINFDFFNLAEIPTFTLCNPNKEKLYALGGISERKYTPRYNAISELNFRADEYIDGILMPYYAYIVNRRLVYVDSIGYFMITGINENNDGIIKYKEVDCQSLEVELSSRKLTSFVSGNGLYDSSGSLISLGPIPVTLTQLYIELQQYLAGWTFDIIPDIIDTKYRSFDVADTSIYNLLMTDIEEAYECIFDFDTINDVIFVYDANEDIELTDIFISHDNVITSMTVDEVTDELATCLFVVGGGDLGITYVNPLGNNYIYNFQYFKNTEWMDSSLIDAIGEWENKYSDFMPSYSFQILSLFEDSEDKMDHDIQLATISGSALTWQTQYNFYLQSGSSIDDQTMVEIHEYLMVLYTAASAVQAEIAILESNMDGHFTILAGIADSLSFNNPANFSMNQLNQLQPFIIQSSYVNDNIILTDIMTSASKLLQQASLYNQAVGILEKISMPRYSFEIDSVNFLQIKDLQTFGAQLDLGKKITLEIEPGRYLLPILLGADIDFDNPTNFKLIFGNRLRLNDETYRFNDLMTKALNAGTAINLNSQAFNNWTRDYKAGYLNLTTGITVGGIQPAEKIDINPGSINLISNALLWNGIPLNLWGLVGGGGSGSGLTEIKITLFSGGVSVAMYDPTPVGLNAAITAARVGDVIFLPDVDITGNFSIPTGINLVGVSSRESIIEGQVTIEPGCLLENLKIINQANSADGIYTVIATETTSGSEISRIKGCEIYAYQCGSGSTVSVYISGLGVDLLVENSTIVADSNGGVGYAFSSNGGNCNVYHSQYYAKTEVFHDI